LHDLGAAAVDLSEVPVPDLASARDLAVVPDLAVATTLTVFAGQLGGWGGRDGIGQVARFGAPDGIVSGGAGTLYVADTGNSCVRKIVLATGEVTTLAGKLGEAGSVDGVGAQARFRNPWGLAYDAFRRALYVADPTDETIRRISIPDATVTTLAG